MLKYYLEELDVYSKYYLFFNKEFNLKKNNTFKMNYKMNYLLY